MTTTLKGREIAVTRLIDGEILIGKTATFSTTTPGHPRRTTYRGTVYDISRGPDGRDYAYVAVLGMPNPIIIALESLPEKDDAP